MEEAVQASSTPSTLTPISILTTGVYLSVYMYVIVYQSRKTLILLGAVLCPHRVFEREGVKVVADELTLELVDGCTVDYHTELIKSSFQIVGNPKAESTCSCGTSFAPK